MTTQLTLPERVGIIILVSEVKSGKRSLMNSLRDLKAAVNITKQDISDYGIIDRMGGGIDWDISVQDNAKEFTLDPNAMSYITARLKELDKENNMHVDLLAIANKLLDGGGAKTPGKTAKKDSRKTSK